MQSVPFFKRRTQLCLMCPHPNTGRLLFSIRARSDVRLFLLVYINALSKRICLVVNERLGATPIL